MKIRTVRETVFTEEDEEKSEKTVFMNFSGTGIVVEGRRGKDMEKRRRKKL